MRESGGLIVHGHPPPLKTFYRWVLLLCLHRGQMSLCNDMHLFPPLFSWTYKRVNIILKRPCSQVTMYRSRFAIRQPVETRSIFHISCRVFIRNFHTYSSVYI
ncbi:hypothetical protein GDO81_014914 [Engystomops pustulosus]|uniref:Secreted protein n=1 Tax=Engystomops pustulosus TaxID=76066 RepID=A0AAV7AHQ1_ENGPU|nr:hypothetical protein GDO81_014914 [Engystomops pustulosus]